MKRDAFDIFKGIVLLIATSLMVTAYTTIERSVLLTSEKTNAVLPGFTPVDIALMGKSKDTKLAQKAKKIDYVVVKYRWQGMRANEKNSYTTRYTLLLL